MGLELAVNWRLEGNSTAYIIKDYRIEMERQRATTISIMTDEPLKSGDIYLLSGGYAQTLDPVCALECMECRQINAGLFESELVEPLYQLMQQNFFRSGCRETASEAMQRIAEQLGFELIDETQESKKRFNSVFLGTIRNALDQISTVYGLNQERWHFDLLKQKLYFLNGGKKGNPLEIPDGLFIEENDQGVEFEMIPNLRPHHQMTWRGKDQIVDRIVFDSNSNSMFVKLSEPSSKKQLSLMPEQTALMRRGFPGLGGYQSTYYFKIDAVHAGSGAHKQLQPVACMDGHILTHDFKIDPRFEKLEKVPIYKSSAHIDDLPDSGQICLLEFPYWQSNTAILRGVIYDGQSIDVKENEVNIHGVKKIILDALNEIDLTTGGTVRIGSESVELLTLFHDTLTSYKKLLKKLNGTVAPAGTSFPGKLTQISPDLSQLATDNDAVIEKLNSIKK